MRDIWPLLTERAKHAHMVRSSRHAAAIVYKGQVLSYGLNSLKSHPIMMKFGRNEGAIYLHAEMDAIVKTINIYGVDILKKCDIYVTRIKKDGSVSLSKPCKGCQRAIEFFKIKRTFHT